MSTRKYDSTSIDFTNLPNMYEQLGKVIKKYRIMVGMNQKDLAEGICDKSYITLIEKGQRCPNGIILFLICNKLKIPIQLLYQTLYKEDIEKYMPTNMKVSAGLRRMDYISAENYRYLNENFMLKFVNYHHDTEGAEILVSSLKKQIFSLPDLDEAKSFLCAKEILETKLSDSNEMFYNLYDMFCISDYVLLCIFTGQSKKIYETLKSYLKYLEKQIMIDEEVMQMKIILEFEMSLVCNDLKKFKESNTFIEQAMLTSRSYTLLGTMPQLYYAKGETMYLQGDEFMGSAYIRKGFELHEMLHPKEDKFTIVKTRARQKHLKLY